MFKRIRIAFLLYLLLFAAASNYLASARSTDWDAPLWVNVHLAPDAAGTGPARHAEVAAPEELAAIETFFNEQAAAYGVALERPFRFNVAGTLTEPLPELPEGSLLDVLLWSLKMRWRATSLDWRDDVPTPDITLFVVVHEVEEDVAIERSGALRKGLIAVAHLFSGPAARGSNRVVVAHELLHTLGATDKYDPASNAPLYPIGYADPGRVPRYPQTHAELMAGRIPVDSREARIPEDLDEVVIGPVTALEIGWLAELPGARHGD